MSMYYVVNSPTPSASTQISYVTTTPSEYEVSLTSAELSPAYLPPCNQGSYWPPSSSGWVYYNCESQDATYSTSVYFVNTTGSTINVYYIAIAQGGLAGKYGGNFSAGGGGGGGGQVYCPPTPYTLGPNDALTATLYPNGNSSNTVISYYNYNYNNLTTIITLEPGQNGGNGGSDEDDNYLNGGNGGSGGGSSATTITTPGLSGGGGGGGGGPEADDPVGIKGSQTGNGTVCCGSNGTAGTSSGVDYYPGVGGGGGQTYIQLQNGGYQYPPCWEKPGNPGTYCTYLLTGGNGGDQGYNGTSGYLSSFMVYYQP